jgi:[ribosomal protein S18]-alanine N-acetyltransferase
MFGIRLGQLQIGMATTSQHADILSMIRYARFRIIHFGLPTLTLPVNSYQISAAWYGERPLAALVATPAGAGAWWIRALGIDGVTVADHTDLIGLLAGTLVHQATCDTLWYNADSNDPWLSDILHHNGFQHHTTIIGMEQVKNSPPGDTTGVAVISALPADAVAVVAAIDAQAFSPEWQKAPPDLAAFQHADHYAVVATLGGSPVGYALATWHAPQQICHLVRIAVVPAYQGRGIARQLLHDVIAHAHTRGAAHITLNTQHDNHAAQALYARSGFVPNGERYLVSRALSQARAAFSAAH